MRLYLVRHGKAEPGADDHARRLTARGRSDVEKVARRMRKAEVRVGLVEHSGLVRAVETAEIVAAAIGGTTVQVDDLQPLADVARAGRRLEASQADAVMLVGHQPYMGRMASYLLTGDPDVPLLHITTAGVVCLTGDEGRWQLEWLLTPDIA